MLASGVPQSQAQPGDVNGDAVDRFTLGHAAVGAVYGLLDMPWPLAVALAVGWEFVERPLKDEYPKLFPYSSQDSTENAVFDTIAVLTGYSAAKRYGNADKTALWLITGGLGLWWLVGRSK